MLRGLTTAFICLLMLCITPVITLLAHAPSDSETTAVEAKRADGRVFVNFSLVRRIYCRNTPAGISGRGTAFAISPTTLVTADHVLIGDCVDEATGAPIVPFYRHYEHDFALVRVEGIEFKKWFDFTCEGYAGGHRYSAIGYMYGEDLVETHLLATFAISRVDSVNKVGRPSGMLRILRGDIYKGMSGGPIVGQDGVVVGINTATDHKGTGLSRDLKDTALCRQHD